MPVTVPDYFPHYCTVNLLVSVIIITLLGHHFTYEIFMALDLLTKEK